MCQSDVQHAVKAACSCTVVIGSPYTVKVGRLSFLGHYEWIKMSHSRHGI